MRSLLFVPADSERKLAKAFASGADTLILDLEDSVAAARKGTGREMARAFLEAEMGSSPRPRLYVRINALETDMWEADLAAVMPAGPDGIMLPKPRSGDDVHRLSIALNHAEQPAGIPEGTTKILPIVSELPISILRLPSYVGASSRLVALNWGMEDLSAELGAASTRGPDGLITSPFRLARDLTLYTAVAAGVQPLDAVYPDFRDIAGLKAECEAAARDGFTGKAAIHPDQVAIINAAFTPSAAEIGRAQTIVRLFSESPGAGVISYNGQMLDRPHLTRAERLLARVKPAEAG
jgi:citrate lyase subunit beta/citryl-CoA lyase